MPFSTIFSMPRVGGTMFGRVLCSSQDTDTRHVFINEPGHLGKGHEGYCPYFNKVNPRNHGEIDRLINLVYRLEKIQSQFDAARKYPTINLDSFDDRLQKLKQSLDAFQASLEEKNIESLLTKLEQEWANFLHHNQLENKVKSVAKKVSVLVKDHTYFFNDPDFLKRLNRISSNSGNAIFILRDPKEHITSMLLRRIVHFVSEKGDLTNNEIAEFIPIFFFKTQEFSRKDINEFMNKRFPSGDQISRTRFLQFIGKNDLAKEKSYQISVHDMEIFRDKMLEHVVKMFKISWENFAHFYKQALEIYPVGTTLIDFNALLINPETYLKEISSRLSGFNNISNQLPDEKTVLYNFPEKYIGKRGHNIWFSAVSRAKKIVEQKGGVVGTKINLPPELANNVVSVMPIYQELLNTVKSPENECSVSVGQFFKPSTRNPEISRSSDSTLGEQGLKVFQKAMGIKHY